MNAPTDSLSERVDQLFASDPEILADPSVLYRDLREAAPVHRFGPRIIVTRHSEVKQMIRDNVTFSNAARAKGRYAAYLRQGFAEEYRGLFDDVVRFEGLYVSRADGDTHDRLRGSAHRVFTPRRIAVLGDAAQSYLDQMLEPLSDSDLVEFTELAYRLPLMIIGDLLGLPRADYELVHAWTDALARNLHNTQPGPLIAAHQAMTEFKAYVEAMVAEHRGSSENPTLVQALVDAETGERMSSEQVTAMFVVLLFAGHETTTNLMATGLLELLRRRDQWEALCADPSLAPSAVEELLRWVAPAQFLARLALVDTEVAGYPIAAGEAVIVLVAAANRDPEVFSDPELLNIQRPDVAFHLTFGFGTHFCLGNALARLEGAIWFRTLAQRFPQMSLAAESFDFEGSPGLRKLSRLPVHMGGASAELLGAAR
jgi:cytochrome P450